jgi:hypothetical protein
MSSWRCLYIGLGGQFGEGLVAAGQIGAGQFGGGQEAAPPPLPPPRLMRGLRGMTMGRMTMGFQNQKASDWPMSTTATANAAEDTFMVFFFFC